MGLNSCHRTKGWLFPLKLDGSFQVGMNAKTEERFKCGQMVLNRQEAALHLLVTQNGIQMQRRGCKEADRLWRRWGTAREQLRCDAADSCPRSGSCWVDQVDRLTCFLTERLWSGGFFFFFLCKWDPWCSGTETNLTPKQTQSSCFLQHFLINWWSNVQSGHQRNDRVWSRQLGS